MLRRKAVPLLVPPDAIKSIRPDWIAPARAPPHRQTTRGLTARAIHVPRMRQFHRLLSRLDRGLVRLPLQSRSFNVSLQFDQRHSRHL